MVMGGLHFSATQVPLILSLNKILHNIHLLSKEKNAEKPTIFMNDKLIDNESSEKYAD
jgi:hypothetical protein